MTMYKVNGGSSGQLVKHTNVAIVNMFEKSSFSSQHRKVAVSCHFFFILRLLVIQYLCKTHLV